MRKFIYLWVLPCIMYVTDFLTSVYRLELREWWYRGRNFTLNRAYYAAKLIHKIMREDLEKHFLGD